MSDPVLGAGRASPDSGLGLAQGRVRARLCPLRAAQDMSSWISHSSSQAAQLRVPAESSRLKALPTPSTSEVWRIFTFPSLGFHQTNSAFSSCLRRSCGLTALSRLIVCTDY